ncbi:hypothetical protein PoB_002952400 [Plakobranchus ocellatus]|uniref:Uncharacterized protein n=1 Tax=Plakobranchus ocellatus TaxID=259542 RepID=A0AAV4A5P8_9GAST|nr:hypothetical protein PoB_002952400 [Plakobranchus ocellatus]
MSNKLGLMLDRFPVLMGSNCYHEFQAMELHLASELPSRIHQIWAEAVGEIAFSVIHFTQNSTAGLTFIVSTHGFQLKRGFDTTFNKVTAWYHKLLPDSIVTKDQLEHRS